MGAGVKEINLGMQLLEAPAVALFPSNCVVVRRTRLPFLTVKLEGIDSGEEGGVNVCTEDIPPGLVATNLTLLLLFMTCL